jgi:hypothetical protein
MRCSRIRFRASGQTGLDLLQSLMKTAADYLRSHLPFTRFGASRLHPRQARAQIRNHMGFYQRSTVHEGLKPRLFRYCGIDREILYQQYRVSLSLLRKPHRRSEHGAGRGGVFCDERRVLQPETQRLRFDVEVAGCFGDTAMCEQRCNRLFRAAGKFRTMSRGPRLPVIRCRRT